MGLPCHFSISAGFGPEAVWLLTILNRVPPPLDESVLPLECTWPGRAGALPRKALLLTVPAVFDLRHMGLRDELGSGYQRATSAGHVPLREIMVECSSDV